MKDQFDLLDKTLSKVNEWLRFAETKNGALIGGVCAVMFGIQKAVSDITALPAWLALYIASFFICCTIALIISLLSFLPRLKAPFWLDADAIKSTDNPFFFGHACKYSGYTYLKLLNIKGAPEDQKVAEYFAEQIINNSKIAVGKYAMFSAAAWCFLAAILTPVGSLLIRVFMHANTHTTS